jgi:hypothetical protein
MTHWLVDFVLLARVLVLRFLVLGLISVRSIILALGVLG